MPIRPYSAGTSYSLGALLRSSRDTTETINMTVPAAASALPQSAASGVQNYTEADQIGDVYVCSGTIVKLGDTYGVLSVDAKPATSQAYITAAEAILFQIVAADSASITPGVDCYIVDATMRVTHNSNSGANKYIGKFRSAPETNPGGLPAGLYASVNFRQSEI